MRSPSCLAIFLVAGVSISASAQTASTMKSGTAPVSDATFVHKAALSDMYEIRRVSLRRRRPPAPAALDATHRALLDRLRSASRSSFDHLYLRQQVGAHRQAVMLFTSESRNGKDSGLKNFARETLPTLQQHLSMAQQFQKGGAATP